MLRIEHSEPSSPPRATGSVGTTNTVAFEFWSARCPAARRTDRPRTIGEVFEIATNGDPREIEGLPLLHQ